MKPETGSLTESEKGAGKATASEMPARKRALWMLLSPLFLLVVLAVLMRVGGATTKPGASASGEYPTSQAPERVQYVGKATQKELEATINGQLAALRRQDFSAALAFAHRELRDKWSSQQFQEKIEKTGFAIMPVSSRQEFHKALQVNQMTTVLVTVRKPDGDGAGFVYGMVQEDGQWRIAACTHALDPAIAEMPR